MKFTDIVKLKTLIVIFKASKNTLTNNIHDCISRACAEKKIWLQFREGLPWNTHHGVQHVNRAYISLREERETSHLILPEGEDNTDEKRLPIMQQYGVRHRK